MTTPTDQIRNVEFLNFNNGIFSVSDIPMSGGNSAPVISFNANASYTLGTVLSGSQIFSVSDADGLSDLGQITLWDNTQTAGAVWRYNGQEITPGGLSSGGFQFDYANRDLLTYIVGDGFNDFGFTAQDNSGATDYETFAITGTGTTPPTGDGNNTLNTAQILTFSDRIVTGSVGGTDPDDYFRFVTSGTGTFTIDLSGLGADIDLRLLDYQGNVLSTSTVSGSSNETITYSYSDNQLYYARVDPHNSAQSSYSLGLDVTADTTPPPPSPTTDPDLQITAVSVSDTTWSDGESISVDFTVENTGGDAASSRSGIYLSTNDNFSYGDILIDFESQGTMNAGEVDPETESFTVDFAEMGIAPGTYYLGVLPDYEEAVSESSENNNDDYSDNNPIQITVVGSTPPPLGLADLEISSFQLFGNNFNVGEEFDFSASILNSGTSETGLYDIAVYVTTDTAFSNPVFLFEEEFGNISAGESEAIDFHAFTNGTWQTGDYYLAFVVDSNDDVSESDETNNIIYTQFLLNGVSPPPPSTQPDIVANNFTITSASAAVLPGAAMHFTGDIANVGNGDQPSTPVAGVYPTAGIYLSFDSNVTTSDILLHEQIWSDLIAGTADSRGQLNVVLPSDLSPGTYHLAVIADNNGVIVESGV